MRRVNEQLKQVLSEGIGELKDPRIGMVTVTGVEATPDLRDAKVFVTVAGTDEDAAKALRALQKAAPYVRRQLATSLSLRHAPQIFFVRDTVEERANRVDQLLGEIAASEPPAPGDEPAGERGEEGIKN